MPKPRVHTRDRVNAGFLIVAGAVFVAGCVAAGLAFSQEEEYEAIDNTACADCHEASQHGSIFADDLSHSVHDGLECLDCHTDRGTVPHQPEEGYAVGCQGCRTCHDKEAEEYQAHGRAKIGTCGDIPHCSDCHGSHDILPSTNKYSPVNPTNLPETCGKCHENLNITSKYEILIDHPVQVYEASVHGKATKGGIYVAATCNDCHSADSTAHKILAPSFPESSINFFNIPSTCGKCHRGVEQDYEEGIHGKMVRNGETDAPVCTSCHGEHGILAPSDPNSPVSPTHVAERTCARCHDSAVLNEKYGVASQRLVSFVDSYHGLKSKAGDTKVANCASCHGVHRILPSSDPTSTVNPANLQATCGECHPKISEKMASTPIHGVGGKGLRTKAADIVAHIYIVAIMVIIGLMVLHWLIDLIRHLITIATKRPQIRRMRPNEVAQHALLTVSFITLVISGFALTYDEGFVSRFFFGWEGGFAVRGIVHRAAAVVFILTVVWHVLFLLTPRGRKYLKDMWPVRRDFAFFGHRILHNIGLRPAWKCVQRFNYVEKAEYWALVWGTVVMIGTGLMLWFDNWFVSFLPKGVLDVALVVHFYEAWLASLAILVWHMYAVIFHPHVYPMNPSWITGTMPEEMYEHEHPGHLEQARRDTEEAIEHQVERMRRRTEDDGSDHQPAPAPGGSADEPFDPVAEPAESDKEKPLDPGDLTG